VVSEGTGDDDDDNDWGEVVEEAFSVVSVVLSVAVVVVIADADADAEEVLPPLF